MNRKKLTPRIRNDADREDVCEQAEVPATANAGRPSIRTRGPAGDRDGQPRGRFPESCAARRTRNTAIGCEGESKGAAQKKRPSLCELRTLAMSCDATSRVSSGGWTRTSRRIPGKNVHSRFCWGFTGDKSRRTALIWERLRWCGARHSGHHPGGRVRRASAPDIPEKVLPNRLRLATAGGTVATWNTLSFPHHATGDSIMRTLATDGTAEQMLDYLAGDGAGGEWTYFADLGECCGRGDDVGPTSRPGRKLIRHPPALGPIPRGYSLQTGPRNRMSK